MSQARGVKLDIEVPLRPKKPVTPWIAFVRERKEEIMSQRRMTAPEIASILSKEWRQIDRSRYEQDYFKRREDYLRDLQNFENSLTEEQRDMLDVQKSAKRENRATKEIRKTNPPVLPRNSANFFCKKRSKDADIVEKLKTQRISEVFSNLFKEYRRLPADVKRKYVEMQEQDRVRFRNEFLDWYKDIHMNRELTKAAKDKAKVMRDRLKALNYI